MPEWHIGSTTQRSVFLCHSSGDKAFVRRLAEHLRSGGIRVWLDEAELLVGDSLIQRIGTALAECDFVGVVLSQRALQSEWVQVELRAALAREIAQQRAVVLPILLEPLTLPTFLSDKVYADFTKPENESAAVASLVAAVYGRAPTSSAQNAASLYANAEFQRDLSTILRSVAPSKVPWTPSIPRRILDGAMASCGVANRSEVLCVFDLENSWFWSPARTAVVFTTRGMHFGGKLYSGTKRLVHQFVAYEEFPTVTVKSEFHSTEYGRSSADWRSMEIVGICIYVPSTLTGVSPDDVRTAVGAIAVLVRRYKLG